jgi:hypothetical protein
VDFATEECVGTAALIAIAVPKLAKQRAANHNILVILDRKAPATHQRMEADPRDQIWADRLSKKRDSGNKGRMKVGPSTLRMAASRSRRQRHKLFEAGNRSLTLLFPSSRNFSQVPARKNLRSVASKRAIDDRGGVELLLDQARAKIEIDGGLLAGHDGIVDRGDLDLRA